jgi:hypothetical protein
MYVHMLRNQMESRAMIRFFTLKEMKPGRIHTEREPVHGPEALALPTVAKWLGRFQQSGTDLFDGLGSRMPLVNRFGEGIGSVPTERLFSLRKVFCHHFHIEKMTCLRVLCGKLV